MIIEVNGQELRQYKDTHLYVGIDGEIYNISTGRYLTPYNTNQYLCVKYRNTNGIYKNLKVHRMVAETWVPNPNPERFTIIDHINRNGLDNSAENLRWVDIVINNHNKDKRQVGCSSIYKGVYRRGRRWVATISQSGRRIMIGSFDTELEAGQAYDRMAIELFGDYATINDC